MTATPIRLSISTIRGADVNLAGARVGASAIFYVTSRRCPQSGASASRHDLPRPLQLPTQGQGVDPRAYLEAYLPRRTRRWPARKNRYPAPELIRPFVRGLTDRRHPGPDRPVLTTAALPPITIMVVASAAPRSQSCSDTIGGPSRFATSTAMTSGAWRTKPRPTGRCCWQRSMYWLPVADAGRATQRRSSPSKGVG